MTAIPFDESRVGVLMITLLSLGLAFAVPPQEKTPRDVVHDLFGVCVGNAGDLDGDSVSDLWIGDSSTKGWSSDSQGCIWGVSGKTGKKIRRIACPDGALEFGRTLAALGDIDGDGVPDVVTSAEFVPTKEDPFGRCAFGDAYSPLGAGEVYAFSGASGRLLRTWRGPADLVKVPWYSAGAGPSLTAVGDWNADGVGDFAIGWSYADAQDGKNPDCGRVDVVSGTDGTVLHSWLGVEADDRLGFALASIADVDGDGVCDLAASAMPDYGEKFPGAPPNLSRERAGYVLVLASKGGVLHRITSPEGSRRFGFSLTSLPQTADGADLAVSQCHADSTSPCVWLVSAVRGEAIRRIPRVDEDAWNGAWRGKGVTPAPSPLGESFGSGVLSLRDFDGDGLGDLLVTMPQSFCAIPAVVLSRSESIVLSRIDISDQAFSWSHVGNAVCTLGDLDGDGIAEFAVAGASIRCGDCDGAVVICDGKTAGILRVIVRRDLAN
jgi:hypothetical protein